MSSTPAALLLVSSVLVCCVPGLEPGPDAGGGHRAGGAGGGAGAGGSGGGVDAGGGADAGGGSGADAGPCGDPGWADLQLGTAADDELLALVLDADGRLTVAGYEGGLTGVTNVQPTGNSSGFVIGLTRTGARAWERRFDTAGTETVEALALGPGAGEVTLAGRTTGQLTATPNAGQFDLFVARLAGAGTVERLFQTGGAPPEHPTRLSLQPDGLVIVAGHDDLFVHNSAVVADDDGFVVALELDREPASERWAHHADSPIGDRVTGLAVDADGGTFVAGFENGGGTFVRKLDARGVPEWTLVASAFDGQADTVALSPAGRLVIAGGVLSPAAPGGRLEPGLFVSERDALGAELWSTTLRTSDLVRASAIAFDASGHAVVAGRALGRFPGGPANAGGEDLFVVRFDEAGAVTSLVQRGTAGDDVVTSLAVDACGHAFVGGFTTGALAGPSAGGRDAFVLRLAP